MVLCSKHSFVQFHAGCLAYFSEFAHGVTMNILNSIFGGRIRIANELLHVAANVREQIINKIILKNHIEAIHNVLCHYVWKLSSVFNLEVPSNVFSIGFFWTLRGCKSPLRLAQVAPSMYKGRLLLWLRAIRSIRSRQNWGVCCRNDVRLRLFHLGHGLMHDMGRIDPFPLVLLVRAGAWFAVFGKSTTPCILMAGTWNKSQKHLPPVASSQSSLGSFVFVDVCWFPCSILSSSILQCKECLRGKRAHHFSKSHLENDFQTISVVHSEIANAMSEPNYCTCDSVWCTHKTEACLVFLLLILASMFPLLFFHHFPCFLLFFSLYGFRAECIKQPEFYSGLRVENNLRCEPTRLNFPWAKVNLFNLCCF